jgi:1,4-dihydroxy-2-naphthoate octaprenyltransferase
MSDPHQQANPLPETFSGDSFADKAKRALHASRPKFFPASIAPVAFGTAWGVYVSGGIDWLVFALALLATVCVHAASNVLNDVGDDAIGTDPQNVDRIYPYTGGSRFIQTGILSSSQMARLGISQIAIAAIAGMILIYLKGPMVLYLGLAGVALAVFYSLGPAKLSSLGIGELAIVFGFGVIPICGAAWLQGAALDMTLVLISLPIGIWVSTILLINEVPDIAADAAAGKRTLPVRFGRVATSGIYLSMHLVAAAVTGWLTFRGVLPLAAPVVPVLLLALTFKASKAIQAGVEDRPAMTKAIESTLTIQTIGSLWLVGCALYLHWWGAT